MSRRTAIVTGASGFIGRWAVPELLRREFEVHAVIGPATSATPIELSGARVHKVNLFEREAVSWLLTAVKPSHLIHFAWTTTPGVYRTSLDNISWVAASLDLLRSFQQCGGERFVGAGSCSEYATTDEPCAEETTRLVTQAREMHPLYAVAKASLSNLVAAFAAQAGLSSAWGRIFFQFGPYEHRERLVASVISALLHAEPALCTYGRQIRGYLSSMDVGEAFAALLDSDVEGSVNISTAQRHSIEQLVTRIGAMIGRPDLIRLGARAALPGESPVLTADVNRLYHEVSWRPARTLDQGLEQTIAWWRTQLTT